MEVGRGLTTVQGIVNDHRDFITLVTAPKTGAVLSVHPPAQPEAGTAETRAILEEAIVRPD